MVRVGILTVGPNNSRIDGVLLGVRNGNPNELSAATNFLQNSGFVTGNRGRVTGSDGAIGNQPVFFMTRVEHAVAAATVAFFAASAAAPSRASRAGRRAGKKKTSSRAGRRPSKETTSSPGGKRRPASRSNGRKGTKKR